MNGFPGDLVSFGKFGFKNITDYIAEDRTSTAVRFVNKLFKDVERLSDFPESGRMVPEFNDPVIREVIRNPFRIVYRVDKKRVSARL